MLREKLRNLVPAILDEYRKKYGLRDLPISVEYLRPIMEMAGWVDRISWEEFQYESQHILAQVEFFRRQAAPYKQFDDCARVQFSMALNFCWRRFAICKEMYHAVIDSDPQTRVTTVAHLLKLAESLVSDSTATLENFLPHRTEEAAIILTIETLFPLEYRNLYEEAYRAGKINDLQLATRFRIPIMYAETAMYPSYLQSVREAREGKLLDLA